MSKEINSLKFSDKTLHFVLSDDTTHEVVGGWDFIIAFGGLKKYEQDMNIKIVRNVECPDCRQEDVLKFLEIERNILCIL